MLALPAITLSVLLLGRLGPGPGPAAAPYRASQSASVRVSDTSMVAVVTLRQPGAPDAAFSKPPNLNWQTDWTLEAAHRAAQAVGFHMKNTPAQPLRETPWIMDVRPALLRGGTAAVIIKVDY